MIREKITRITSNKFFALGLTIIINILFFLICNNLFSFKYEQVDDFIIMNLISKLDGNYNIYGVQIHPLICGIIILLYKTGININWYSVFMLMMQFVSFTIIGTVFIYKNKKIGIPIYLCFIFIIYSKMLMYIQYTTVAILCIASGMILLIDSIKNIEKIKKINLVISILMIAIGCLIRFSTIIIALPFMGVYFICKLIEDKNIKVIKIGLLLFILICLVNVSFNLIYNLNPVYREFLKFHDARTYLHDYNWMSYISNKETFDDVGWTKNDRDIFYAYCFGDEEVYNTTTLKKLEETAVKNTNNINWFSKIFSVFRELNIEIKDDIYEYVFLLVVILTIVNNLIMILKKEKDTRHDAIKVSLINLILIIVIGMHCLFIYLGRPMFRVVISIYILGIVMLMYIARENMKFLTQKAIIIILLAVLLVISGLEFKQSIKFAKRYNIENFSVYKEILEYTSKHKENAYLYTLVMRDRFLAYSVYEKIPDNSYENLRPLGDWDTYTKNYYNFKEKYNLDNLMKSLYEKENVYLISGNVIWGEQYEQYINIIEKYILEHYNVQVDSQIIKEFDNDIKIYKLKAK